MRLWSRRHVFAATSFSAAAMFSGLHSCGTGQRTLGSRYRETLCSTLDIIKSGETPVIRESANLLATAQLARRHCFIRLGDGSSGAQRWSLPGGLPRLFVPLVSEAMAEAVRPGDVLITTDDGDIARIASARGATLIGITSPVVADRYESQDRDHLATPILLGDICDLLIDTHLPVWDGLVDHPSYPFGILPGSGVIIPVVVAMLAGEAFHRAGGLGRTTGDPPTYALEYLDVVRNRLGQLGAPQPSSIAIIEHMYDCIVRHGTISVLPDDSALIPTIRAHAGIPVSVTAGASATQSSSTVVIVSAENDAALSLLQDVVSTYADSIVLLTGTDGTKAFGNPILTNITHSPEPDGVLQFDHGRRYLTTASVLNEAALWMLAGDAVGRALDNDITPPFLMGAHLTGSNEYNRDARNRFSQAAPQ